MNIINELYSHRDEKQAASMSAYMKDNFSFLGLKRPERSILQKSFFNEAKKAREIDWAFVYRCWELPEREFQYLALDYLISLNKLIKDSDIEKLHNFIVIKSWWDTVDSLSANLIGELCAKYPYLIDKHILEWSDDNNIWLKRTAILFQLKYKNKTDTQLLSKIILNNCNTKEFFINKAIGWILREYSKTNKEWVRCFVYENKLSSLSFKEASKYL